MLAINSSEVRKDWSGVLDTVTRRGPVLVKRNRDHMVLCSDVTMAQIVAGVTIVVDQLAEEDGSVTLSAEALDIVVNGPDLETARASLVTDLIEYAEEYFQEFQLYSQAPNRQGHLPYVMKALTAKSPKELEDAVVCRVGKN